MLRRAFVLVAVVLVALLANWLRVVSELGSVPLVHVPSPYPEIPSGTGSTVIDLTVDDGAHINPAAIGFARRPTIIFPGSLDRTAFGHRFRTKRFEYWGLITDRFVIGLTIADLDYVSSHGIYVVDRHAQPGGKVLVNDEAVVPFGVGSEITDVSVDRVRAVGSSLSGQLSLSMIDNDDGSVAIRGRSIRGATEIDITVAARVGDALAVTVPWSRALFHYTVKNPGRRVQNPSSITINGTRHELCASTTWAVLDRGRGRWPYARRWNWAVGQGTVQLPAAANGGSSSSGKNKTSVDVALQLGAKWTTGTGSSECAFFLNGRLHFLGLEPKFTYSLASNDRWTVAGPRIEATFIPDVHRREAAIDLLLVKFSVVQLFGHWSGRVKLDDGTWFEFKDLIGWAEEADNLW